MTWLTKALEWAAQNWGFWAVLALLVLVGVFLWIFRVDVPGLLDRLLLSY